MADNNYKKNILKKYTGKRVKKGPKYSAQDIRDINQADLSGPFGGARISVSDVPTPFAALSGAIKGAVKGAAKGATKSVAGKGRGFLNFVKKKVKEGMELETQKTEEQLKWEERHGQWPGDLPSVGKATRKQLTQKSAPRPRK